jgi:hypothetical protein
MPFGKFAVFRLFLRRHSPFGEHFHPTLSSNRAIFSILRRGKKYLCGKARFFVPGSSQNRNFGIEFAECVYGGICL